MIQQFDF